MVAEELARSHFSTALAPRGGCSESNHEAGDSACGRGRVSGNYGGSLRGVSRNPDKAYEIVLKGYADLAGFYGVSEKPTGFERVVCEITLESDSPAEKLRELERLVEERCVRHGTLRHPVDIETHWSINNQQVRSDNDAFQTSEPGSSLRTF
jgi:hypothetical protein